MILYYLSSMIFMWISFFMFIMSMLMMLLKYSIYLEWNVISLYSSSINMYVYIDWMTLMFMFIVLLISSMILMYCNEYMSHDKNSIRFFYLIFLFIMSMLLMIISPNMISIIIGWDGLGLISYLLVIYYNTYSSYNSGMLTVLMNRVGDVLILMSIEMMLTYGSWNFMNFINMNYLILIMVMIATFTKSAQFPFSAWLPAAMAAPTPVSSLVHYSTLVTAGIYLLIRFQSLISQNYYIMEYIKYTGMITMLLAGISAIVEYDLKKIIAFPTLSQLGMMMVIYSMHQFELTFFHLIIHAIFKSMMFMCSGVIIHNMNNYQDIRMMGNVKNNMPLTFTIMMVASFSLCGMPFLSGFYSKDMILEYIFTNNFSLINKKMLMISTGLTIMYSSRLSSFLSNNINNSYPYKNCIDSMLMNNSMIILLIMTLMFGYLMKWILFNNIEEIYLSQMEKLNIYMMCIISFFIGKFLWYMNLNYSNFMKFFFNKMWLSNFITSNLIYYPLKFGYNFYYYYEQNYSQMMTKNMISLFSNKMFIKNYNNQHLLSLFSTISMLMLIMLMMMMMMI
uniref:NADH-ubiquinone oxidoreductase chain 5 n=1 Tax=Dolichoris vasculosae TaxID=130022 RepID=A0A8A2F5Y4_9HYME|nr:NADH dehydrogenase subunit 5 [Dolichoris vasculosae]